ncbi:hypothetical protein GCM10009795_096800 [Nocardioides hankookensis]
MTAGLTRCSHCAPGALANHARVSIEHAPATEIPVSSVGGEAQPAADCEPINDAGCGLAAPAHSWRTLTEAELEAFFSDRQSFAVAKVTDHGVLVPRSASD